MKYTLYINLSDPSSIYREAECNKGIDRVPALLDEIRRRGEVVQIRNAAEMSKEELLTAYFTDAAVAAVVVRALVDYCPGDAYDGDDE